MDYKLNNMIILSLNTSFNDYVTWQVVTQPSAIAMLTHIGNTNHYITLKCHISVILDKLLKYFWKRKTNLPNVSDNLCEVQVAQLI